MIRVGLLTIALSLLWFMPQGKPNAIDGYQPTADSVAWSVAPEWPSSDEHDDVIPTNLPTEVKHSFVPLVLVVARCIRTQHTTPYIIRGPPQVTHQ